MCCGWSTRRKAFVSLILWAHIGVTLMRYLIGCCLGRTRRYPLP
jgi:hypothetical protein